MKGTAMGRYLVGLLVTCIAMIGAVMLIGAVIMVDGWFLVIGLVLVGLAWRYTERHPSET